MVLCRPGQAYDHGRISGYGAHPERLSCKGKKGAKEGNTDYSELKEHILSQAKKEESKNCANDAATSLFSDDAPDAQDASDDFAVPCDKEPAAAIPSALADTEEAEKRKQHVQDIYATRKRRKKTRNAKKSR